MSSTVFQDFVRPARQRAEIWRTAIGAVLIVVSWLGLSVLVIFGAGIWSGIAGGDATAFTDEISTGRTPRGLGVLLFTFLGLLLGTIVVTAVLHRRGPVSLFGRNGRVWSDFFRVIVTTAILYGVFFAGWLVVYDPVPNLAFSAWIAFLPIGIIGLGVQTLAEEIAFRGYLMQQLAARFRSPFIWMGGSSLAFGAMHFNMGAGLTIGLLTVLATFIIGLITADLTRRTGSISAAWALHFGNNFFAMFLISVQGTIPGAALYLTPYSKFDTGLMQNLLVLDIATTVLVWAVLVRVLRR